MASLVPLGSTGSAQVPAASSHGLTGQPDQLLGSGRDYVIELTPAAVTFTPALGADVAQTARLTIRRRAVRAGELELVSTDLEPAPQREGDTAVYDLGGGVRERWTVGPGGVELSYVLAERPAADGPLTVLLDADASLGAPTGSRAGGWSWLDADGNGVRVGAVTGIDADGREAAGWIDVRDGEIELGLPASFVRDAAYPLVLDPLFGAVFGVNGSADGQNPAVATMDSADRRLVVWELPLSAFDTAIQAQLTDLAGNPVGGLITVQGSAPNTGVDVGVLSQLLAQDDRYVVVWEVEGLDSDVLGSSYDKDGNFTGTFVVAGTPGVDEHSPALDSGEVALTAAWVEAGAGIRSAGIFKGPTDVTPVVLAPVTISSSPHDHSPAVGETDLGASLVVWVHSPPTGSNRIQGRVAPSGAITDLEVVSDELSNPTATSPQEDDFVVAWEVKTGSYDIRGLRVRWVSGQPLQLSAATKLYTSGADERYPALASGDREVALASWRPGGVALRYLDALTLVDLESESFLPLDKEVEPDVAGLPYSTLFSPEFLVVWPDKDPSGGSLVFGQAADDNVGTMIRLTSAGCDAEGAVPRCGAAVSDHPAFQSEIAGAEPGVLAILGVGFVNQSIPWGGGVLVPQLSTGFSLVAGTTDATGYAQVTGVLPPGLTGVIFWEQWALLFGSPPWCAPGLYDITDALEVTIDV
ncbi:MAG: hypothetical protein AAF682_31785 [Planctomycetota bacterium]